MLKLKLKFVLALSAWMLFANGAFAMPSSSKIAVDIRITDPNGKPIPYVTIWGFVNPSGPADPQTSYRQFSMGDLWRVSLRYKNTYELASRYATPVAGIRYPIMGDASGAARDIIDFNELNVVRPPSTTIGYTFMRRGYVLEKAEIHAAINRSSYVLRVVLQPDSLSPPGVEPAYLHTFDRVRWELSDSRRNEEISEHNRRRLEGLRHDMEQAAHQAIAAGDKKSAARIYARMETMPEITMEGGISGFAQANEESQRNQDALRKAIELAPDDEYLRMRSFWLRGRTQVQSLSHPMSESDRTRFLEFVQQEEKVMAQHGDTFWMYYREGLFADYKRLGLYEKAYQELRNLRQFEPRGDDYDDLLRGLKASMRINGVTAPSTWN